MRSYKKIKSALSLKSHLLLRLQIISITLLSGVACESTTPNAYSLDAQSYQASEALLAWLKHRVDLLVKHKADCQDMALALFKDQAAYKQQLNEWRKLKAGSALAQRAIKNSEFSRSLNQLILKGDLVHSYCAYQSDFREQLQRLNAQN